MQQVEVDDISQEEIDANIKFITKIKNVAGNAQLGPSQKLQVAIELCSITFPKTFLQFLQNIYDYHFAFKKMALDQFTWDESNIQEFYEQIKVLVDLPSMNSIFYYSSGQFFKHIFTPKNIFLMMTQSSSKFSGNSDFEISMRMKTILIQGFYFFYLSNSFSNFMCCKLNCTAFTSPIERCAKRERNRNHPHIESIYFNKDFNLKRLIETSLNELLLYANFRWICPGQHGFYYVFYCILKMVEAGLYDINESVSVLKLILKKCELLITLENQIVKTMDEGKLTEPFRAELLYYFSTTRQFISDICLQFIIYSKDIQCINQLKKTSLFPLLCPSSNYHEENQQIISLACDIIQIYCLRGCEFTTQNRKVSLVSVVLKLKIQKYLIRMSIPGEDCYSISLRGINQSQYQFKAIPTPADPNTFNSLVRDIFENVISTQGSKISMAIKKNIYNSIAEKIDGLFHSTECEQTKERLILLIFTLFQIMGSDLAIHYHLLLQVTQKIFSQNYKNLFLLFDSSLTTMLQQIQEQNSLVFLKILYIIVKSQPNFIDDLKKSLYEKIFDLIKIVLNNPFQTDVDCVEFYLTLKIIATFQHLKSQTTFMEHEAIKNILSKFVLENALPSLLAKENFFSKQGDCTFETHFFCDDVIMQFDPPEIIEKNKSDNKKCSSQENIMIEHQNESKIIPEAGENKPESQQLTEEIKDHSSSFNSKNMKITIYFMAVKLFEKWTRVCYNYDIWKKLEPVFSNFKFPTHFLQNKKLIGFIFPIINLYSNMYIFPQNHLAKERYTYGKVYPGGRQLQEKSYIFEDVMNNFLVITEILTNSRCFGEVLDSKKKYLRESKNKLLKNIKKIIFFPILKTIKGLFFAYEHDEYSKADQMLKKLEPVLVCLQENYEYLLKFGITSKHFPQQIFRLQLSEYETFVKKNFLILDLTEQTKYSTFILRVQTAQMTTFLSQIIASDYPRLVASLRRDETFINKYKQFFDDPIETNNVIVSLPQVTVLKEENILMSEKYICQKQTLFEMGNSPTLSSFFKIVKEGEFQLVELLINPLNLNESINMFYYSVDLTLLVKILESCPCLAKMLYDKLSKEKIFGIYCSFRLFHGMTVYKTFHDEFWELIKSSYLNLVQILNLLQQNLYDFKLFLGEHDFNF